MVLVPAEASGQRRNRLQPYQHASHRIVLEDRDAGDEFVEDVRASAVWVEGHVARPRARSYGRKRHGVGAQRAAAEVQIQDIDLVGTQVDTKDMIPVEVGEDLVCVWSLLAGGIWAGPVTLTLEVSGLRADVPVRLDRKDREIAGGVVGRKQVLCPMGARSDEWWPARPAGTLLRKVSFPFAWSMA